MKCYSYKVDYFGRIHLYKNKVYLMPNSYSNLEIAKFSLNSQHIQKPEFEPEHLKNSQPIPI